jgi:hypothetical protein
MRAKLLTFSLAFILLLASSATADECEWCDRGAVVSKCENPELPSNYEELFGPHRECMERALPKDDPSITITQDPNAFARQRCKHPHPRIDFTTASSNAARIAEIHTTSCFHMIGRNIVKAYRAREERGLGVLIKPTNCFLKGKTK